MDDDVKAECIINEHGRMISANKPFAKQLSMPVDEIEWHYLFDYFKSKDAWNLFKSGMTENKIFQMTTRFRKKRRGAFTGMITAERIEPMRFKLIIRAGA